jgi:hypothetical protein
VSWQEFWVQTGGPWLPNHGEVERGRRRLFQSKENNFNHKAGSLRPAAEADSLTEQEKKA